MKVMARNTRADLLTIRGAAKRAAEDGIGLTEYTLRHWVKTGEITVRYSGNRALIYYPAVVEYLTGNGGDKYADHHNT